MKACYQWIIGLIAVTFALVGFNGQTIAQTAYNQLTNHNHMIDLYEGICRKDEKVTLEYYGFMAFLITSPCGLRILTDPWRDAQPGNFDPETGGRKGWDKTVWIQGKFPSLLKPNPDASKGGTPYLSKVDVVLSSHAHFDHDNVYGVDASTVLDRMIGAWEFADVKITGYPEKHVCTTEGFYPWDKVALAWTGRPPCPPNNATDQDNILYFIEIGTKKKISILFMGDNRAIPSQKVRGEVGKKRPDILISAVDDSGHITTPKNMVEVKKWANNGSEIVSHYYIKDIPAKQYTMLPPTRYVVSHPHHKFFKTSKVTFTREEIDNLPRGIVMSFEDHVAFEPVGIPKTWEEEYKKSLNAAPRP